MNVGGTYSPLTCFTPKDVAVMIPGTLSAAAPQPSKQAPFLLHHFFENAARTWPNRIAVDTPPGRGRPERRLTTYADLLRQADAVATALGGSVAPDTIVAILLPRDSERIYSAQLGVLRAGGAYTCIEPTSPDGRIAEILEDAQPFALITDRPGADRARAIGFTCRIVVRIGSIRRRAVRTSLP